MNEMPLCSLDRDRVLDWYASGDTGISSETMACIAAGLKLRHADAPYDPSDFGRCYRLVKKIPAIRDHFPAIGRRVKTFRKILEQWDEICVLYEEELPTGTGPKLYARIKALRGDRS